MKNQVFNINRFGAYAAYNFKMNSRMYLTQLLSVGFIIMIMPLISMWQNHYFNGHNWMTMLLLTGAISLGIFIGNAFPYLRKKEAQMTYYLLPVSTMERFTFEFLLRFVGFFIIFPLLFFLEGHLVYFIVERLKEMKGLSMADIEPISSLLDMPKVGIEDVLKYHIVALLFLVMSLIFAGTTVFMKNPMMKTVAFVMAVLGVVGYYFYLFFEKLQMKGGVPLFYKFGGKEFQASDFIVLSITIVATLLVLSYAFFKLKEKEV